MSQIKTISLNSRVNYEKVYFYAISLFALTLPLSKALISLFIILLPLIWIVEADFRRKYEQIKSSKLLLALLAYLLFSFIAILYSNNLETALHMARKNIYLLALFVIATSLKKEYLKTVISMFLTGMFISEIIAYGVFFELWTFNNATPQNPTPIMHHIDYSVFMAFSSILLLNRIFAAHYSKKEKIFFILFFITVTGNLFLSIGRTGQTALIAGIIVMTLLHFRFSFKSFVISLLLLSTIFFSAYQISDSFKKRSHMVLSDIEHMTKLNFNTSLGIRAAYWVSTYNIFIQNPLIGVGLGDYIDETAAEVKKERYDYINSRTKKFMSTYHPHNQYLLVMLQMGVIGLLLLSYLIYSILKLQIDDPEIKELSILFVTIYFMASMAEPLLLKQFTLTLFILFSGIFAVYSIDIKKSGAGNDKKTP